jgi:HAD superfamily hydrolase (TIGR01509 family)
LSSDSVREPGKWLAAVVFDLDGVLLDSESAWDAARRAVVAEAGGRWQPSATADMMGMSSGEWSRYLRDRLGVSLEPDEINRRVVATLLAGYQRGLPLIDGAVSVVRRLGARWPLGLASSANRPVIDAVLAGAGLAGQFAVTVSGDEVDRGKPAPDVYLAAARALAIEPTDAAAVEDSTNGLLAASAAGMLVVAAPNRDYPPGAHALALADLVVASLDEITPEALEAARAWSFHGGSSSGASDGS